MLLRGDVELYHALFECNFFMTCLTEQPFIRHGKTLTSIGLNSISSRYILKTCASMTDLASFYSYWQIGCNFSFPGKFRRSWRMQLLKNRTNCGLIRFGIRLNKTTATASTEPAAAGRCRAGDDTCHQGSCWECWLTF